MRTYSRKFWMPTITMRGVFAFVYLWRIPATTLRERSERNLKTWGGCKMHENVKFTLQREVLVKNYELVQYSKRILHIINFLSTLTQQWYSEICIIKRKKLLRYSKELLHIYYLAPEKPVSRMDNVIFCKSNFCNRSFIEIHAIHI